MRSRCPLCLGAGFSKAPNPKFNVDVDRLIATYAYQVAAGGQAAPDYFVTLIGAAGARA